MTIEPIPIAIYNTDLKRLEYITNSIAEASRIIIGKSNVTTDTKVRYALKNKKRITTNNLGYTVAVREATIEQISQLGKNKLLKIEHASI